MVKMNKNKKIIIGILIVLIICIVIAYKIIEDSVTNREDFNFTVENINSSPVNTIDRGQNEI